MAGSVAESIVGTGAIVIAILGVIGLFPTLFLSIATLAIGASLLLQGGAIMSRVSSLSREMGESAEATAEIAGGLTAEIFAGLVGITLGILSLVGIYPVMFPSIAAIVFGSGLIMSTGTTMRINNYAHRLEYQEQSELVHGLTSEAVRAASGVQFMIGLGVVTLGILALVGINPLILTLVAMLAVGVSDLINGSAITSRIMGIFG